MVLSGLTVASSTNSTADKPLTAPTVEIEDRYISARVRKRKLIGAKRCIERYVVTDLVCPLVAEWNELKRSRSAFVVATGSSLDCYVKVFELAGTRADFTLILLGTVLERLSLEGKLQTLDRCKNLIRNSGNGLETLYFTNQFMLDQNGKLMSTVLDALHWLRFHIEKYNIPLVVVSENEEFTKLVQQRHFQVMSAVQFFTHNKDKLPNLPQLAQEIEQNLVNNTTSSSSNASSNSYSQYWTPAQIQEALSSSKKLIRGKLEVSSFGPNDYVVRRPGSTSDHNFTAENTNRAIHGDDIVVYDNKVVAVTKRNWRPYVVVLSQRDLERLSPEVGKHSSAASQGILCVPMDSRIPKIRIVTRQPSSLVGTRFVVSVDNWPLSSRYPIGHYVRTLGPIGDVATEASTILVETSLENHLSDFSPNAMACLPKAGSGWKPKLTEGRRDLRSDLIFSVDPPGCMDIDDAMSFRKLDDNLYEVGVHIADVTNFVKAGSSLDIEAAKRATSVYLKDRRLDMLPRLLCEDLCSLRSHVERFAVSVIWTLSMPKNSAEYKVQDVWMGRTLIRSAHALSYTQAQRLIDGLVPEYDRNREHQNCHTGKRIEKSLFEPLRAALMGLADIANRRERERESNGALQLQGGGEFKFSLDATHKPSEVHQKTSLQIHGTVAELMIMANEYVARRIVELHPQAAVVRKHSNPPPKKMAIVLELAKKAGVSLDPSSNESLAHSMVQAQSQTSPSVFAVINDALIRAMSEAQYVCAGLESDFTHFGLGLEYYTHFTSPIRRYADVMVHRLLLSSREDEGTKKTQTTAEEGGEVGSFWAEAVTKGEKEKALLFGGIIQEGSEDRAALDDDSDGDPLDDILGDPLDDLLNDNAAHPLDDILDGGDMPTLADPLDDILDGGDTPLLGDGVVDGDKVEPMIVRGVEAGRSESLQMNPAQIDHINKLHRAAKEASFRSEALFFSLFFQRNPQIVQAMVIGIRDHGLLCFVVDFQLKVFVRFDSLNSMITICKTVNGNIQMIDHEVVYHYNLAPGSDSEYQSVNITAKQATSGLPPLHFEILSKIPAYLCCEETWSSRIPTPKLVYYCAESCVEKEAILSKPAKNLVNDVKEFAITHSPSNMMNANKARSLFWKSTKGSACSLYEFLSRWATVHKEIKKIQLKDKQRKVLTKGRFNFNGYKPAQDETRPYHKYDVDEDDTDAAATTSKNSFTSIQHDRRAVAKYISGKTKDATRRMERLKVAKRETKIKNRKKQMG